MSNTTRGVFAGGYDYPAANTLNTLQYITIASTGNATDFGDLITAKASGSTGSNGHG